MNFPIIGQIDFPRALELINANHALGEIKPEDVYVFSMELSNQNIDMEMARMHKTSIDNFVGNFNQGMPLLISHDRKNLPIGRIFAGETSGTPLPDKATFEERGNYKAIAYAYIQKDIELSGQRSNDIIKGIDSGVINDVSISFELDLENNGSVMCSICDKDALSPSCKHIPGKKYGGQRMYLWLKGATAVEGSLVFAGGTPETKILSKVRNKIQEKEDKMDLEKLISTVRSYDPNLAIRFKPEEDEVEAYNEVVKIIGEKQALVIEGERKLNEANTKYEADRAYIDLGKRYVGDMIDQAVAARVKAVGQGNFDEDKYRLSLNRSNDIEDIKDQIKSWNSVSEKVLGTTENARTFRKPDQGKPFDNVYSKNSYKG